MSKNAGKRNDAPASRGQHARRFARIGILTGAVIGLGGGFTGVLKFAIVGAIGGAVTGMVAGKKLAPLADKISAFLPGRRKKEVQQEVVSIVPEKTQAQEQTASKAKSYQDLGSIDPEVLAELREGINGAVTKLKAGRIAEEGMLKEGEPMQGGWVDAVSSKRPTHPAHLTYQ